MKGKGKGGGGQGGQGGGNGWQGTGLQKQGSGLQKQGSRQWGATDSWAQQEWWAGNGGTWDQSTWAAGWEEQQQGQQSARGGKGRRDERPRTARGSMRQLAADGPAEKAPSTAQSTAPAPQPAVQPATQPAPQPAAQPAPQPAAQRTPPPAAAPTPPPAAPPAPAPAAAAPPEPVVEGGVASANAPPVFTAAEPMEVEGGVAGANAPPVFTAAEPMEEGPPASAPAKSRPTVRAAHTVALGSMCRGTGHVPEEALKELQKVVGLPEADSTKFIQIVNRGSQPITLAARAAAALWLLLLLLVIAIGGVTLVVLGFGGIGASLLAVRSVARKAHEQVVEDLRKEFGSRFEFEISTHPRQLTVTCSPAGLV